MGKGIKSGGGSGKSGVKPQGPPEHLDRLVRFSFKYYSKANRKFGCGDREASYFLALIDRLRDLSTTPISTLKKGVTNKTTRFHSINFAESRVSESGFGIPGYEEFDEDAWEFSLSANEHGRVHGFLIENVFYVVWFDPHHALYVRR